MVRKECATLARRLVSLCSRTDRADLNTKFYQLSLDVFKHCFAKWEENFEALLKELLRSAVDRKMGILVGDLAPSGSKCSFRKPSATYETAQVKPLLLWNTPVPAISQLYIYEEGTLLILCTLSNALDLSDNCQRFKRDPLGVFLFLLSHSRRTEVKILASFFRVISYFFYTLWNSQLLISLKNAWCIHDTKHLYVGFFLAHKESIREIIMVLFAFLADLKYILKNFDVCENKAVWVLAY